MDNAWVRSTRNITAATIAVLVLYLAWYLHRHSDFSNDDLDNFVLMQHTGFWKFLMMPADVHYVPLHRLMSWIAYHVAPMNFSVAIVILLTFHVGTLILLVRTLHLLKAGQFGDLIVCGYASSAILVYGLMWWAHAEHRAPYVFLDACAIYNYLAWTKNSNRFHLLFVALAFVAAFGFYEKAVLIPIHMLLVGYLADERYFRLNAKKFLSPPVLLLLGSAVYVAGYLALNGNSVKSTPLQAIRADLEFAKVFFATASGAGIEDFHDVPTHGMSLRLLCLILVGGAVVVWGIWRRADSWKVLLAGFLILMLDYLPIALSNRATWSGLLVMHQSRFGYEELHLFALLAGIWSVRVGIASAEGGYRRTVWLIGFALVLVYAGTNISYVRWGRQHPIGALWVMEQSHQYLGNLRGGLAQISDDTPVFENDRVPHYLSLFWTTPDTRSLLPLFLPRARFSDTASPRYQVQQDGHIVLVQ